MNKWARAAILLAGILLGQIILFGPSLLGQKILLPLDLLAQPGFYLPTEPGAKPVVVHNRIRSDLIIAELYRQFAVAEVRAGRLPCWIPYELAGDTINRPLCMPCYVLGYLINSPLAIAWGQVVQALIAGVGAYLFCRSALGVGFWPAVIAGWCYPLTGFFVFWQGYGPDVAVDWLPASMLAIDTTLRGTRPWAGAALALVTALLILGGQIDIAGQVLLVSGCYALWRFWDVYRGQWFSRRAILAAAATVLGWSLGLLIASPEIWHQVQFNQTGARMQRRAAGSEERPPIGLAALPQTVLPDMYGSTQDGSFPAFPAGQGNQLESSATAYTGLLATLLLAPLAWCSRRHRSMLIFLLVMGFVALSWQLGVPGLVNLLRMPGLNMFSHNRLVFATSFALLAMMAIGLEVLAEGQWQRRWWFWLPATLLAVMFAWCCFAAVAPADAIANPLLKSVFQGRFADFAPPKVEQAKWWFFRTNAVAAVLSALALGGWLVLWFCGKQSKIAPDRRSGAGAGAASRELPPARRDSTPLTRSRTPRWLLPLLVPLLLCDLLWFGLGRSVQCDPSLYFPPIPVLDEVAKSTPGRVIGFSCLPAFLSATRGLRDIREYDAVDPARYIDLMRPVADDTRTPPISYALTQMLTPEYAMDSPSSIRLHPILDMFGVRYVIFRGSPSAELKPDFRGDDYWALVNRGALPRVFVPKRVETAPDWMELKKKMGSKYFLFQKTAHIVVELSLNLADLAATLADGDPRKDDVRRNIADLQETAKILGIAKTTDGKDNFNPHEAALLKHASRLVHELTSNLAARDPQKAVEYQNTIDVLETADTIDAKDDFNPREVAYVESDNRLELPESCQGSAELDEEIPTRLKVTADMQTPGLVVLADLWDTGWNAYLDGRKVPILRTNHAIRGVEVPAGKSTIEFRYEPVSLVWGLRFAGAALLASVAWLGVGLSRPVGRCGDPCPRPSPICRRTRRRPSRHRAIPLAGELPSAERNEGHVHRKTLTAVLKVGLSLGIVAYLVWNASNTKDANGDNVFQNLVHQPKHWGFLAAALGVFATALVLTFVRWWVLVRALGLPARLNDTIRVGFWGLLFNLAPLGVVGGDLVKAVMLSRKHPSKQAGVVASVIVDRLIGLYILFVVATVAILVTGFWKYQIDDIGRICNGVFLVTGLGGVGIIAVMVLNAVAGHWVRHLHRVPRIGPPIANLLEDVRLYRHRLGALLIAALITVVVHTCSSISFYLIARGLPGEAPPLSIHFVIVPLSISSGVVPLPMGPLELVLEFFYTHLPMCGSIAKGQGLLVALVSRLNGILLALTGVLVYLRSRGDLADAMHIEAEAASET